MKLNRHMLYRIVPVILVLLIIIGSVAIISQGLTFTETTNQLTNGNTITAMLDAVIRYGNKVYFTTIAGGYCRLVEVDKQGNYRELQLFENAYDPTYGEDDDHGVPSIVWIEEGKKILAVGGSHTIYTPKKWAVVDVENWTITASGDFGSESLGNTVLVKTNDGKISLFVVWEDPNDNNKRKVRWYEFDPSNNTWTLVGLVTSTESKTVWLAGYNIDNGNVLITIAMPGTYGPFALVQFDPVNKKFLDVNGNELTLPFDHSTLFEVDRYTAYIINGYVYAELYDSTNLAMYVKKYDLSHNELASKELCSQANGVNTAYLYTTSALLYFDGKLWVIYRDNDNKTTIATVDLDTLDLTVMYKSSSNDIVFWPVPERYMNGTFVWHNTLDTSGQDNWATEASGDHITYIVFIDNETITTTTTPAEPHFKFGTYPISVTASPGQNVTLNYQVINDGGSGGDVTLRIKDSNGTIVYSKTVYLDAGADTTIAATITAPSSEGTYNYTAEIYNEATGQVDASATLTITVDSTATEPTVTYTNAPSYQVDTSIIWNMMNPFLVLGITLLFMGFIVAMVDKMGKSIKI